MTKARADLFLKVLAGALIPVTILLWTNGLSLNREVTKNATNIKHLQEDVGEIKDDVKELLRRIK